MNCRQRHRGDDEDSLECSSRDFASAEMSALTMDTTLRFSVEGPKSGSKIRTETTSSERRSFTSRGTSKSSIDGPGTSWPSTLVRASSVVQRFSHSRRSSFTINKLHFNRHGLYGREEQLRKLKGALEEVFDGANHLQVRKFEGDTSVTSSGLVKDETRERQPQEQPQQPEHRQAPQQDQSNQLDRPGRRGLVLIHGMSGTGKTALAKQIDRDVRRRGGFFVTGKFDVHLMDEPYAAIKSALGQICRHIIELQHDSDAMSMYSAADGSSQEFSLKLKALRDKVIADLSLELAILLDFVPSLKAVIDDDYETIESRTVSDGETYKESSEALKYATRRFLQVISEISPLAIMIDDCQWADQACLELLNSWVIDDGVGRILFISCYRDDEMDEGHILKTSFIDRIKVVDTVRFYSIAVGTISVSSVNSLIADAMNCDESDETMELATIVHAKTHGNPFFIIQFLLSLTNNDHLVYNLGAMKWSWDKDVIRTEYSATDNVADLMGEKLKKYPAGRHILPIAACLGSTFDVGTIRAVKCGLQEVDTTDEGSESLRAVYDDIEIHLDLCVDEGFVEIVSGTVLKFVHDKVQEAALNLLDENELKSLRFKIGNILLQSFSTEELDNFVFQAANLLGFQARELSEEDPKRVQIAKLNMKAGKKALEIAAFESASKYLSEAIALLPSNYWEIDPRIYVNLYTMASSAMYCTANFDQLKEYCKEVLDRAEIPILDKVEICHTLMDTYTVSQDLTKNVQFGTSVLESMGVRFPKSSLRITLQTISGLVKAKMKAKKISKASVKNMPIMSDPKNVAVTKTLVNFITATFFGKPELTALVVFEMERQISEHGLTPYAAICYAVQGLIFAGVLCDFQTARTCAEIALSILDLCDSRMVRSRTIQTCYAFSLHWTTPLHETMKPFMEGYIVGMQTGVLESAFWNIYYHLEVCLYCGQNLSCVDADFKTYIKQMEDYRSEKAARATRIIRQIATTFMGVDDAVDENEMISFYRELKDEVMESSVRRTQIYIACFSGDYAKGADLAIEWADKAMKLTPGQLATFQIPFTGGLASFAMARRTGKKKYKQFGMKCWKLLRTWASKGDPNVLAQEALLEAEAKALSTKSRLRALKNFEVAVLLAGRQGLTHVQALANERFSAYFADVGCKDEAKYRMDEAIKLYSEWGACAKVESLQRTSMKRPPKEAVASNIVIAWGSDNK